MHPIKLRYFAGSMAIFCSLPSVAISANAAPTSRLQHDVSPLAFFVGSWSCTGHFANGKPISSRETYTPILDGHWLEMRHTDQPPHRYNAIELWQYDPAARQFSVHVFDNFGGERHYLSTGWEEGKLVLHNTATSGYTDRFVFERHSAILYEVTYASRKGAGTWKVGDTLICKRN